MNIFDLIAALWLVVVLVVLSFYLSFARDYILLAYTNGSWIDMEKDTRFITNNLIKI